MNRSKAVKEIRKYSSELNGLVFRFEDRTSEDNRYDEDVKSVKLILPLEISSFFPLKGIVASLGKLHGVNLDFIDTNELEPSKGANLTSYFLNYRAAYITECTDESEIKPALNNLENSKRELDAYLERIYRFRSRMKHI